MFIFPAFINPTLETIGVIIPLIGMPFLIVAFVIWLIRKLNRIEIMLNDIKEKLK